MKNYNFKSKTSLYFLVVVFSFSFLFFNFGVAIGAELLFEPKIQEIRPGDFFQVDLFLDTGAAAKGEEEINAVEGRIIFPADLLEIKEILDGDSIINFWTKKPCYNLSTGDNINTNQHEIFFSGVIPGGFKGILSPYYEGYKPGKILSLILKTKTTGEGLINLKDVKVLLNDGLGTPAQVSILPFQFKITWEAPQIMGLLPIKDPDPPELFEPIITQDPNVFEGKWFLMFNAQDKGSGIDYYAIHESTRKKETTRINTKDWTKGESPYLLKDQKLRSYIYVKTVDKAGNERIATLSPRNLLKWYENYLILVIIITGAIVGYIIWRILWRKHTIKY